MTQDSLNRPANRRTIARQVQLEYLDELSASDPRAMRGRDDLRRVNIWMGNARILARALSSCQAQKFPRGIVEIGGGDGTLLLAVAKRLQTKVAGVEVKLVDRQKLLTSETRDRFQNLGWNVEAIQSDATKWLAEMDNVDLVVANLFLHHFEDSQLRHVLAQTAPKTKMLIACEPRRFAFPRLAGLLLRLIGCSAITQHDATISVQAGFAGQELSELWPQGKGWQLKETEAGLFSHLFLAVSGL